MALKVYSLARDGALHLTPHFRVREFACRDGSDPIFVEEELAALRPYVAWYRKHGALLRGGELHRLVDPEPNGLGAAWMLSAKDGSEAAVFAVGDALSGAHGIASPNSRTRTLWEALV